MKRVISLILCLMFIMSMATTAFAAGHDHVITINSKDGYVYEAYQIFTGDLDEKGTLSNIEWGSAVNANAAALLAALKAADAAYKDCNDAEDVANVLAKDTTTDNATAMAFADIVAAVDADGNYLYLDKTKAFAEADKKIAVNHDGYYLIVNTKIPNGPDTTYSRHMLEVVRDVSVTHKGTFPTIDKKIVEGSNKVNINEASIGDEVKYEIVGNLPNNLSNYDTYYYVFTDTLSKGLSLMDTDPATDGIQNNIKVTVNGVDVTKYFYIGHTDYDATEGTTITVGIEDILALELAEDVDVGTIKGGLLETDTKVIVTYSAVLNENAVVAVAGNPNAVDLQYSNDPNQDGDGATTPPPVNPNEPDPVVPTGKTPEKTVETWTTELHIQKTDGTGAALSGAQFQLTGTGVNMVVTTGQYFELVEAGTGTYYKLLDGTYTTVAPVTEDDPATENVDEKTAEHYESQTADYNLVTKVTLDGEGENAVDVKAFVDENGQLSFTGLGAGEYTLTETVTPKGFNTIDPINFTVTFNAETKMFRTNNTTINVGQSNGDPYFNSLYTTVVNHAGSTLPSTGGMGTTLIYTVGGLMVAAAAILLITKKRMSAEV